MPCMSLVVFNSNYLLFCSYELSTKCLVGASLSEPHIDGTFMRELFIGASLSEPHIDGTFMRELFIYIIMYVWYDRHPRRRSYTIHCAHSKIFRAIQTACCNVCVLHCAYRMQACNIHCHVFEHRSSYVCALVLIVIVEFRNEDI